MAHTTIPRMVREAEAAEILGVAPRTLADWRFRGVGPPYVRISARCVRYRVTDLEAWAAGLVRRSTADDGTAAAKEAP